MKLNNAGFSIPAVLMLTGALSASVLVLTKTITSSREHSSKIKKVSAYDSFLKDLRFRLSSEVDCTKALGQYNVANSASGVQLTSIGASTTFWSLAEVRNTSTNPPTKWFAPGDVIGSDFKVTGLSVTLNGTARTISSDFKHAPGNYSGSFYNATLSVSARRSAGPGRFEDVPLMSDSANIPLWVVIDGSRNKIIACSTLADGASKIIEAQGASSSCGVNQALKRNGDGDFYCEDALSEVPDCKVVQNWDNDPTNPAAQYGIWALQTYTPFSNTSLSNYLNLGLVAGIQTLPDFWNNRKIASVSGTSRTDTNAASARELRCVRVGCDPTSAALNYQTATLPAEGVSCVALTVGSSSAGPVPDPNCDVDPTAAGCPPPPVSPTAAPNVQFHCDFGMGTMAPHNFRGSYHSIVCVVTNHDSRPVVYRLRQLAPTGPGATSLTENFKVTLASGRQLFTRWYYLKTADGISALPNRSAFTTTYLKIQQTARVEIPGQESATNIRTEDDTIQDALPSTWYREWNVTSEETGGVNRNGNPLTLKRVHTLNGSRVGSAQGPTIMESGDCACSGENNNYLNISSNDSYIFPWYVFNRMGYHSLMSYPGCYVAKECSGETSANPAPNITVTGVFVNADGTLRGNSKFNDNEDMRVRWRVKNMTNKPIVVSIGCSMMSERGAGYGCDKENASGGNVNDMQNSRVFLDAAGGTTDQHDLNPRFRLSQYPSNGGRWHKESRHAYAVDVVAVLRDEDSEIRHISNFLTSEINP